MIQEKTTFYRQHFRANWPILKYLPFCNFAFSKISLKNIFKLFIKSFFGYKTYENEIA